MSPHPDRLVPLAQSRAGLWGGCQHPQRATRSVTSSTGGKRQPRSRSIADHDCSRIALCWREYSRGIVLVWSCCCPGAAPAFRHSRDPHRLWLALRSRQ
jgi:hypothetical protein